MQVPHSNRVEVPKVHEPLMQGFASACFAILWIRGLGDERAAAEIIDSVERLDGVVSAGFARREPFVLSVGYDRAKTRTQQLLDYIRDLGVEAKIVGC